MIPFNKPPKTNSEIKYLQEALDSEKFSGDGVFGKKCQKWFDLELKCKKVLLTPSCTAALEMAAVLLDIKPGDEVIMPSYTFVSTANAFVLRGASIVFVDIRPDTMNIDESKIEEAITRNTKVIVPVHYAGVACEMNTIMGLAEKHGLFVVEDAAQGMMSTYEGKPLGTIGHLGAYSFHETKNYTSGGEGGLLIINDSQFVERAEIIREKGTNRSSFFRGQVDKYTWVDVGSSFLPSELQAAYLWGQLENADVINERRRQLWDTYRVSFERFKGSKVVELPTVPDGCSHNAHMFYLKVKNLSVRSQLISYAKDNDVMLVFHYVPLHSAPAGKVFGTFSCVDKYTTKESERLVRLPLFYNLTDEEQLRVIKVVSDFLIGLG